MAGWPVRFNGKTAPVKPAPLLGQHSAEVLKDWLGMSEDQVATLRAEKIIRAQPEAESPGSGGLTKIPDPMAAKPCSPQGVYRF